MVGLGDGGRSFVRVGCGRGVGETGAAVVGCGRGCLGVCVAGSRNRGGTTTRCERGGSGLLVGVGSTGRVTGGNGRCAWIQRS